MRFPPSDSVSCSGDGINQFEAVADCSDGGGPIPKVIDPSPTEEARAVFDSIVFIRPDK